MTPESDTTIGSWNYSTNLQDTIHCVNKIKNKIKSHFTIKQVKDMFMIIYITLIYKVILYLRFGVTKSICKKILRFNLI